MNQTLQLNNNQDNLKLRFAVLRLIREFFWSRGYTEVDPPMIVKLPGQEPNIEPVTLTIHNDKSESFKAYLHTSPEYAMKKMIAAGFDKIFYLGKTFRDFESFGHNHNPEFTMLEFYAVNVDYTFLMTEIEALVQYVVAKIQNTSSNDKCPSSKFKPDDRLGKAWERMTMVEVWRHFSQVELENYLTRESMLTLCKEKGYNPGNDETYEELFYRIFLNEIENKLGTEAPLIVYEYPAVMASLSRLSSMDPRFAERFEIYVNGQELGNAFSELIDADEQLQRLEQEREERGKAGKQVYDVDQEFIGALKQGMKPCAGVAFGVDRLIMQITGCQNIDDVLILPMSTLLV